MSPLQLSEGARTPRLDQIAQSEEGLRRVNTSSSGKYIVNLAYLVRGYQAKQRLKIVQLWVAALQDSHFRATLSGEMMDHREEANTKRSFQMDSSLRSEIDCAAKCGRTSINKVIA